MISIDNPFHNEVCTRRTLRPRCTGCGHHTHIATLTDDDSVQYDTRGALVLSRDVYCTTCLQSRVAAPPSIVIDGLVKSLKNSRLRHVDETAFVRALQTRDVVELTTMLLQEGGTR